MKNRRRKKRSPPLKTLLPIGASASLTTEPRPLIKMPNEVVKDSKTFWLAIASFVVAISSVAWNVCWSVHTNSEAERQREGVVEMDDAVVLNFFSVPKGDSLALRLEDAHSTPDGTLNVRFPFVLLDWDTKAEIGPPYAYVNRLEAQEMIGQTGRSNAVVAKKLEARFALRNIGSTKINDLTAIVGAERPDSAFLVVRTDTGSHKATLAPNKALTIGSRIYVSPEGSFPSSIVFVAKWSYRTEQGFSRTNSWRGEYVVKNNIWHELF